MIDVSRETMMPLSKARFPGRPHVATVWRWAMRGVRGVQLESLLCGGVRYTSEEAVARFIALLNEHEPPAPPHRAAEEAGAALAAKGA
jgi:hypothetical protein